jgi:FkbM family methyltransferase
MGSHILPMTKKLLEKVYNQLARLSIFYPLLFFLLKKRGFLDPREDSIIKHLNNKTKNFFFVQIGANDGIKGDPLYLYAKKYKWKGVLVEPVPFLFKKLKQNYEGRKGIFLENIAIAEKGGHKPFYHLKEECKKENLPLWHDEIGSFIKGNVIKHSANISNLEKYLIVSRVECRTFLYLLKKYNLKKIDLLQIDTEGYDYQILKTFPFNILKPKLIIFEDRHLNENQKQKAKQLLISQGYRLTQLPGDCLAYLN